MKYIRTKDGIYKWGTFNFVGKNIEKEFFSKPSNTIFQSEVLSESDTVEELCDEFVIINNENEMEVIHNFNFAKNSCIYDVLYGAIWTDKGLIYVAKMNDTGELELL